MGGTKLALTQDEQSLLTTHEATIASGLQTFIDVGLALMTIREQQLYRERFTTFEAYCKERWGMSRIYAYRVIEASKVSQNLLTIGNMLPANEAQARPLTTLEPAQQREAWKLAIQASEGRTITAETVARAADRIQGKRVAPVRPPTPTPREAKQAAAQYIQQSPALASYEASLVAGLIEEKLIRDRVPIFETQEAWDAWQAEHPARIELLATTAEKPLPNRPPWPKYTGMVHSSPSWSPEKDAAILDIPVFSEEEWTEIQTFDALTVLRVFAPELTWNPVDHRSARIRPNAEDRREYDPTYGRFIVSADDCTSCQRHFIRLGWGRWQVVRFNDGQGHRTSRRFFEHDWWGDTLIQQAFETANPALFSDDDYRRLTIHTVQTYEMCWFYFRKETRRLEEVIDALKADLAALERRAECGALADDEVEQRALDWLQAYTVAAEYAAESREGRVSGPVLANGLTDTKAFERWIGP